MLVHEATLNFQLVRYGDDEPLRTTRQLLSYFCANLNEREHESFWILCMNPGRRPIFRQRMRTGPLVAAQLVVRDLFHVALLAEARSLAFLRTEAPGNPIRLTLADSRLVWNLRETAKHLGIEIADYLITTSDTRHHFSWREQDAKAA